MMWKGFINERSNLMEYKNHILSEIDELCRMISGFYKNIKTKGMSCSMESCKKFPALKPLCSKLYALCSMLLALLLHKPDRGLL